MDIARRLLIGLLISVALVWNLHADWDVVRMSDGQSVGFSQMMGGIEDSEVVLVGESHDKRLHHELQLDVIRDLKEKKKLFAIGLEMFQTESQQQLDDWVNGKLSEEEFQTVYARNWTVEWPMYRNIFIYARDNRIPMVALNIPRSIVTKVARQGFASLAQDERKELPPNVSCQLNTTYTEFVRKTYQEVPHHAMGSEKRFIYFCEAQSLRNSGMAWNVARYLKTHPQQRLVVLTGILHAVKTGIPDRLAEYGNPRYAVILPDLPEFEPMEVLVKEADFLVQ